MADAKPIYTGTRIVGYRGARAGESFATGAEAAAKKKEEDDWAGFAKAQGLDPLGFSGLGGGAKRSKFKAQFETWRKSKTGNLGSLLTGTP